MMQKTKWVGPTISKMMLVFNFGSPEPWTKASAGIGAQEAFKILHPGIQPRLSYDMLLRGATSLFLYSGM